MSRTITIALILILTASSLLIVQITSAQSIPKPSVPQFIAKYISGSLEAPAFFETGGSPSVPMNTPIGAVELIVTHQQYSYSNGSTFSLYYDVRVKLSSEDDSHWQELFPPERLPFSNIWGDYPISYYIWVDGVYPQNRIIPSSDNSDTIVYLPISVGSDNFYRGYLVSERYTANSRVDIQVKAMVGVNSLYSFRQDGLESQHPAAGYVASGDWSSTQMVTIGDYSIPTTPQPTQVPTQSPLDPTITTQPTQTSTASPHGSQPQTDFFRDLNWEQTAIIALAVVVAILSVGLTVLWRRLPK